MDTDFFKRFDVNINENKITKMFINKMHNYILNIQLLNNSDYINIDSFYFQFCNKTGIEYKDYMNYSNILDNRNLTNLLFQIETIIELINDEKPNIASEFVNIIKLAIKDLPGNINIKLLKRKGNYLFYPKGSILLDEKLVDDVLNILSGCNKCSIVHNQFYKGLKEFLKSKNEKLGFNNSVRDMQLSLDELSKLVLNDKNVGFKQLIKNSNWHKTGLNDFYKQICYQLNEMLDKLAKHTSQFIFSENESEGVIYQTGIIIRLIVNSKFNA